MFEFRDSDNIVAEIVMSRAAETKTIVLVEGATDYRLYEKFLDGSACDIVVCFGRDRAIVAIEKLDSLAVSGVICIVDDDYDRLLGNQPVSGNIVTTDDRDAEVMLFRSAALDRLLAEYSSFDKLAAFQAQNGPVRDYIRDLCAKIGSLRIRSIQEQDGLKFQGMEYGFICIRRLTIDLRALARAVLNNSERPHAPMQPLVDAANTEPQSSERAWALCCGHDLSAVLARALQRAIGNEDARAATKDQIEGKLRLAFDWGQFSQTEMIQRMRAWEARSGGFRCFPLAA